LEALRGREKQVLHLSSRQNTWEANIVEVQTSAEIKSNMGEDDLMRLPEVLWLHDLSRDSEAGDLAAFRKRAEKNAQIRSMHHHVFDTCLASAAVTTAAFELVAVEPLQSYHIIVVARNPLEGAAARSFDAEKFRMTLRESPFRSDRQTS
jgi:hypothetical protein